MQRDRKGLNTRLTTLHKGELRSKGSKRREKDEKEGLIAFSSKRCNLYQLLETS